MSLYPEELDKKERAYLASMHEMALAVANRSELCQTLDVIIHRVCDLFAIEHGYIALMDKQQAVVGAGLGCFSSSWKLPQSRACGLVGQAYTQRSPFFVQDYAQWEGRLPESCFDALRAAVAIPLLTGRKVGGVLFLAHSNPQRTFDAAEVEKLCRFAELGSIALQQARLYERMKNELRLRRKMVRSLRESERRNRVAEQRLQQMAYHDSLTGLPNRWSFFERLNKALDKKDQELQSAAIFMLDLDHFKLINDTLGHTAGDVLIKEVAAALGEEAKTANAFLARIGGDEFAVVAPNMTETEASVLADRLVKSVRRTGESKWAEYEIGLSVGVSFFPRDGVSGGELVKNADSAMYCAKAKGRNTWQCYNDSLQMAIQERMRLERELRKALIERQFLLYYQPQVDIRTGKIIGLEALIRWQHPSLGLVPPIQFIPIAEESGLIVGIGQWVMEEACRQNMEWQRRGREKVRVAVNISARQFHQDWFVDSVQKVLNQSGLESKWLELEITESIAVENAAATQEKLQALRAMGVHISIDDFGTGYSSLIYLKNYPVQTLKIDQTFIRDLTHDESNRAIAQAIIAMGKSLNIEVLAEGVEDVDQQNLLETKDCFLMQGYLFGKPMPPAAAEALLL